MRTKNNERIPYAAPTAETIEIFVERGFIGSTVAPGGDIEPASLDNYDLLFDEQ